MTRENPFRNAIVPLILACTAPVIHGATLEEVKIARDATFKQIREGCRADVAKLSDQLVGALERGRDAAKAAGDAELAKTYETEIDIIKLVGEPPALESPVPAITKMQTIYKTSRDERHARMYRAIAAWQKDYLAELAAVEKTLVSSNQAEAVTKVREERDKVNANPAVVDALAAVSKLESATTAATPAQPNTKPWFSLVKAKWADADGSKYFLGMLNERGQLEVDGKKYQKGRDLIYSHAPGTITYQFNTPVSEFRATGCLEERSGNGNVVFIVETSDGEVYRGQPVKKGTNQEKISVTFKPSTKLVLKVDENGGAAEDWAFWLLPEYR